MKIWNGIDRYTRGRSKVVASIGNYDGVHLGHQAILRQVVDDARRRELPSLLITFDPHPLQVVAPDRRPSLLQTRRQKLDCLEETGLTDLLVLAFDERVAALQGDQFFVELLDPSVAFAAIHVGESFRFGVGRSGDLSLLETIGVNHGFEVHAVPAVVDEGQPISSSAIRAAVASGRLEQARRMLGRPFALSGEVKRGEGRGAGIGFPTANLEVENEIVPRAGVYVTETVALAARYPSMTNVGVRPTFGGGEVTVESHLLEFADDLYNQRIEVRFLARIRDEVRFSGATELADQLARDRAAAEAYFHNLQLYLT
jgi:riboflavin kinase/FMN adenylyltransferase